MRFCTNTKYNLKVDEDIIQAFVKSNPNSYYTYQIIGDYYKKTGDKKLAVTYYQTALTKEIATNKERQEIQKQIAKLNL